jgi:hypothetical protein
MDVHALSVANGFLFPRQQDQIGQNLVAGGAYVPTLFVGMYATLRDAPRQGVLGEDGASCQKRAYSTSHGPVRGTTG